MEQIGLISKIIKNVVDGVTRIDTGRKWLDADGLERKGRISYRNGLAIAMDAFKDAQLFAAVDLSALILSELTFITQELQFCDSADKETSNSLKQAIQSFDDALLALQTVENMDAYRAADTTYPHHHKYRFKNMPKDSFHIACLAHRTRIGNMIRTPGINMAEKELLTQRRLNLMRRKLCT